MTKRSLGTSAILTALLVLAPGAAPAGAVTCLCNLEWTILGGFYENGVESQFQTYGGYNANTKVLSIALLRPGTGGDQVEFGWRQLAGDTAFHWFVHTRIDGTSYSSTDSSSNVISGLHTYRVLYDAPSNQFRFTIDTVQKYATSAGTWTTGLPLVNLERHSDDDDFNVSPVEFRSVWYHGSTWHRWNELGAKCYVDNDDAWSGSFDSTNDEVDMVSPGSSTC